MGLAPETILATLLELNLRLCQPPLPDDEVRGIAHSAATSDTNAKIGFVARLLRDIELWHDENDEPYVTLPRASTAKTG